MAADDRTDTASRKTAWLPGAAAVLAFLACNGAILLAGLLSFFGVTLIINPHIQAATVSIFSVLTLVFVFRGYRSHRNTGPLILAVAGAALVVGTMYISFNKVIETVGLIMLIASAVWNWRVSSHPARRVAAP